MTVEVVVAAADVSYLSRAVVAEMDGDEVDDELGRTGL